MSVISTLNFAVEEAAKEQTKRKIEVWFCCETLWRFGGDAQGNREKKFFVFASRQSVICTQKRSEEKAVILLERIKKRTPEKLSKGREKFK